MMLVILPAANIYDNQQRVAGHKHTPCSREELKKLRALAPRLRELGVKQIICSDLDGQSGAELSRRLNVPVHEWESLRRRNWGKLHGTARHKAQLILNEIVENTVPLKGGDSYASFNKRVQASRERLTKSEFSSGCLLIADGEVLQKLTGAGGMQRYHIYEGELNGQSDQAETVSVASA